MVKFLMRFLYDLRLATLNHLSQHIVDVREDSHIFYRTKTAANNYWHAWMLLKAAMRRDGCKRRHMPQLPILIATRIQIGLSMH